MGCADPAAYHLDSEERAACERRRAAANPAPVGPQFSAAEIEQFNADKREPLLVRKPHNGCLPRLADRPAPMAPPRPGPLAGTTTGGVGCAWSF